jgi:hypothetical protein
MTMAVCLWCGGFKNGGLNLCPSCNKRPRTESHAALSLALSDDLAPKTSLAKFAHEIRRNEKPSVPADILRQAQEAIKDPQLRALAGLADRPDTTAAPKDAPTQADQRTPSMAALEPPPVISQSPPHIETNLHKNAFAILGVSIRDNRRRIVEAAEERSLELDHDICQKARSDLTSTRTRLGVELAWLPGVSPRKAAKILSELHLDPFGGPMEQIPDLALLNVMAAGFELVDGHRDASPPRHHVENGELAELIQSFATVAENLSPDEVVRHLNEDRAVSGFPEIKNLEQLEAEFSERKRYFRDAIKAALNRLYAPDLIEVMTKVVSGATLEGEEHAPELIDELVDSYAVETQGVLEAEAENIKKLLAATKAAAPSGEVAVKPLVDRLSVVVRNWDAIAQPIQLSCKARGIDHDPSRALAYQIRSVAIDLFNEHNLLEQSKRLTGLLQEVFAEVPDVSDKVSEDAEALDRIVEKRREAEVEASEWAEEITFRTEIGTFFKSPLSISPEGVQWKNQHYPLASVTRVRWGAIRRSVNGIPTGTTYTIAFGDNQSEAVCDSASEHTFTTFIDKLWRAVGIRILMEMQQALKAGRRLPFGDAVLQDDGITLMKHKFFGADEPVRCSWSDVHVWSADGSFYIGSKADKKTYVSLSYINDPNTHILEQAIRIGFKKGINRLSEVFS